MRILPTILFRPAAFLLLALLPVAGGSIQARAQSTTAVDVALRTTLTGEHVATTVAIDGVLDEEAWQTAEFVSDFLQLEPSEGAPASVQTEVRVLYGENDLYVGATLYDDDPSGIRPTLGRRDFVNQADWFLIAIDSHLDRRTAYVFGVNAAGVQYDALRSPPYGGGQDGADRSWDAIWESDVRMTNEGWTVEMRIPYSMLRFAHADEQIWGIHFTRIVPRLGETSEWPLVPRTERTNLVAHYGLLQGLRGIQPRRSVQIQPYTVSSLQLRESTDRPGATVGHADADVGMDFKIGLSGSLTLDATVNPDFGQVQSDPAELNLSAFESVLQERRPFFVEGTQIYEFGLGAMRSGLLYTRRIGADAPVIGASKLSGRTGGGLSFGVLAAVTGHSFSPEQNFGVARLSQEFSNQSSIGGILAGFDAPAGDGRLRSLSGGVDWDWRLFDNAYSVDGYAAFTRRNIPGADVSSGLAAAISADKRRGIWTYSAGATLFDARFDPNDVGILRRNDSVNLSGRISHDVNAARPFGPFQRANFFVSGGQQWSYRDRIDQGMNLRLNSNWTFRNFKRVSLGARTRNLLGGYSLFDTRGLGPRVQSADFGADVDLRTDERRAWQVRPGFGFGFDQDGGREYEFDVRANWDVSTRLSVRADVAFEWEDGVRAWSSNESFMRVGDGWAIGTRSAPPSSLSADEFLSFDDRGTLDDIMGGVTPYDDAGRYYVPIYGTRDTRSLDVTLRSDVTFTPTLSIQFYGQLFVARGNYDAFQILRDPDTLAALDAYPKRDAFTLNSFQVNTVLRWEYRPGSNLYLVWTQGRRERDHMNPLLSSEEEFDGPFTGQFADVFRIFPTNVFLVKIDYAFLR